MIVRILGEGQFEVDDAAAAKLDALDIELDAAVEAGDEAAFKAALGALGAAGARSGHAGADDDRCTAEIILPSSDADVAEVLKLLAEGQLSGRRGRPAGHCGTSRRSQGVAHADSAIQRKRQPAFAF